MFWLSAKVVICDMDSKCSKKENISSKYELSTCLHQMLLNTQHMTHVNVVYITVYQLCY